TQTLTPTLTPTSLDPTTLGRVENFVALGHESLGARGWNAGLALSYPCAYIGNRRLSQVAIVDIHDPARPTLVNELHLAPGDQPVELRAVPDLNLLVILNFLPGRTVLTYDVSDCRHPQPLGALDLGAVPHEFFLWRDPAQPARLLLYAAMFYHIQPDLHVVELTDPTHPRRIATWTAADESASGTLHSLSLSPDGRRAYLALWEGGLLVADTSELAEGKPDPRIHLLREGAGFTPASGVNVHSAVRLAGPRYVLLTQELYECPFAGLFIADIANEAHPQIVGRFELPENDPACTALPQPDAVFTAHNPLVVHDLIFVTWYGGGLQALDVSDPTQPRRVGLFVPSGEGAARASYVGTYPVQMWSYPILHEGSLYVSDIQSGLYVLRYTGPGAEALSQIAHAEGNLSVLP
ncbi:MAG: LVIVD repeat-containing protein, partial [Anaerolineales bacterium]